MRFTATMLQKALLSFLCAVVFSAAVMVTAFTGFFTIVETRFYNPSIARALARETAAGAETIENLLSDLRNRFAASLDEAPVRRSFLPNQRTEDTVERARIYGVLLETVEGLRSVQFVDSGGKQLFFSTNPADVIIQHGISAGYRDYTDDPQNPRFSQVQVSEHGAGKLTLDNSQDRIMFSFAFYDSLNVYQGTALFTVSLRAVAGRLVSAGQLQAGDDITATSTPPGIFSGGPVNPRREIITEIASIWGDGLLGFTPVDSAMSTPDAVSGTRLILVSAKTSQGLMYGRLINEAVFAFPPSMKALLLLSVFCTVFLAVFFCLNLRADAMVIILSRLKELQISLIEQFYEQKGEMDWARWIMELEQRRKGVHAEVKRGIAMGRKGYTETDIDSLIDTSWNELLAFISAQGKSPGGIDEEQLQSILNRVLRSASALPVAAAQPARHAEPVSVEEILPAEDFAGAADAGLLATWKDQNDTEVVMEHNKPALRRSGGLLAAAMRKRSAVKRVSAAASVSAAAGGNNFPATLMDEAIPIEFEEKVEEEMEQRDEFAEAEELEELEAADLSEESEEPGELEEIIEDNPAAARGLAADSPPVTHNIKELESQIEFGDDAASGAEEAEAGLSAELEVVSPFSSMLSPLEPEAIVEEPDGIPHINSSILEPGQETGAKLDQDFKDLVGSVTKQA
jgi:hypothetical protein